MLTHLGSITPVMLLDKVLAPCDDSDGRQLC